MDYELDTPSTSNLILMPAGELILSSQPFSAFDFTWTNNFGPGIYDLINAGSIGGTFPSTNGAIDGYPATLSTQGNELVLTVVPEPTTLALLGVGRRPARLRGVAKKARVGSGMLDGLFTANRCRAAAAR